MTEALDVALALPLVIEEEVEVPGFLVEELVGEDVEQCADALLQLGSFPYPVEVGVWLDDMEVGVHRAGSVLVLVGETHIGNGLPVARQCLDISHVLGIERMLLDVMVERDGDVEGFLVARGAGILRETVDGEADGIGLFLGVKGVALVVHAPVHATILLVKEVVAHIVLGTGRSLQVLGIAQHTVGGGECPEDAGVHDGTLLCLGMDGLVAVHPSVEATVLVVFHLLYPVVEDVLLQYILHCFLQRLHIFLLFLYFSILRTFFSSSLISLIFSVVKG